MSAKYSKREQDAQFVAWKHQQSRPAKPVSTVNLKKKIKKQLEDFREGNAGNYALYHKWLEVKTFVQEQKKSDLDEVYRLMWVPKGLSDFRRLEPELIWVKEKIEYNTIDIWGNRRTETLENPDELSKHWAILRTLVSSQTHDGTIGRRLSFLVRDRRSQKYLGVICISGDMLALSPRNAALKIDQEQWAKVVNHSANGSTIIPVQPFGFNFLGGKLLSLLCLSKEVAQLWKKEYGDTLVSVTTTSLWRSIKPKSQYDGLKTYWQSVGDTKGSSPLKITDDLYRLMRDWMKQNYPRDYWWCFVAKDKKGMIANRDNKNRAIIFCYKKLGFKKLEYESHHSRGIYFSRLYKNTEEFLRGEISEDQLVPAFDNSIEALTNYWRYGDRGDTTNKSLGHKSALTKGRLDSLLREKKIRPHLKPEWFRSVAFKTWDETKSLLAREVGR